MLGYIMLANLIEPIDATILPIQPESKRSEPVHSTAAATWSVGAIGKDGMLVTDISKPKP